ncbi:negative elongation factor B-like [Zophobas morio]|uniref:negative elongation factor B-like n=1 Tax=Zophobas morio TaxID=2755281 RepID=UPI0030827616
MNLNSEKVLFGETVGEYIQHGLANTDPLEFIKDFQAANNLHAPTCKPVLSFLDMFNTSRLALHKPLLSILKQLLLECIDNASLETIEELLLQTFSYIQHEELQDIPLYVMRKLPKLSSTILEQLTYNQELYELCPLEIKRQIWLLDNCEASKLFRKHVFSLFSNFIRDFEIVKAAGDLEKCAMPPHNRWQHPSILKLTEAVGVNFKMYDLVVESICKLFESTRNRLFCTLRADILMALHYKDNPLCSEDMCYTLAWCLDGCKRDDVVDDRRLSELQASSRSL